VNFTWALCSPVGSLAFLDEIRALRIGATEVLHDFQGLVFLHLAMFIAWVTLARLGHPERLAGRSFYFQWSGYSAVSQPW
jgi:hypothetical protein